MYMYAALKHVALEESRDQFINSGQILGYIGEGKGIQGHQNSSYLDSTIFALFAVSDVFDSMFLEQAQNDPVGDVKNILWKRIVNPLRRYAM
jgi:ubiquitin thioesterase CYLD